jgi:hypothetical protein
MKACKPIFLVGFMLCLALACGGRTETKTKCSSNKDCDDGLYCNGAETCNTDTGLCEAGSKPNCNDKIDCTVDICDEVADKCLNLANNALCDEGKICSSEKGCYTPPKCKQASDCDDGFYCNGVETCDTKTGLCKAGSAPDCNDKIDCTIDICDEATDKCLNLANSALCDDGEFCNGVEECDVNQGCISSEPMPDRFLCDDNDPLTPKTWCKQGRCVPIEPKNLIKWYTFHGDLEYDWFGISVSGAGDVNGDGYADVIVGARGDDPGGNTNAGSAYVYSGKDGSVLYTFHGDSEDEWFGRSVSGAGDVNGDGYADVIVGAYRDDLGGNTSAGSAYVYSGEDGSVLYTFHGDSKGDRFGYSVSGAGDVNGDGYADVIVGAHWNDPGGKPHAGSAYVYSGKDGKLLYTFHGDSGYDWFGFSVSGAGDVNGDGYADVIVGVPENDPGGNTNAGSAYVYSGKDGSVLYTFHGDSGYDWFGFSVSGASDVNGDGYADVIVGVPENDPGGNTNAGSAYVFATVLP